MTTSWRALRSPSGEISRHVQNMLIVLFSILDVGLLYFWVRVSLVTSVLVVISVAVAGLLIWLIRNRVPRILSKRLTMMSREENRRHVQNILIVLFSVLDAGLLHSWVQVNLVTSLLVVLSVAVAGSLVRLVREPVARILAKPLAINLALLTSLTAACFLLYSGFADFSYVITQDHIPSYVGPKYVRAHPSFAFVFGYPNRAPLFSPYWEVVRWLTQDIPWMNLVPSFLIHVASAFLVFRITRLLCGYTRMFPAVVAAFFFLISVGHHQTLLTFPHCNPIILSFLGLLSLYFFLKFTCWHGLYQRGALYVAIVFYALCIGSGSNFIALAVFYVLVMALKFGGLRRDFAYALVVLAMVTGLVWVPGEILRFQYGVVDVEPKVSLSAGYVVERLRLYPHSVLETVSLFFPGVPAAVATLFYDSRTVLGDVGRFNVMLSPYVGLFVLVVPLLFLDKGKALYLYGLIALMLLLVFPFIVAPRVLNQRHISQTIVVSSVFMGVFTHYLLDSVGKVRGHWLRKTMNWSVILLWAVLGGRLGVISRTEIGRFIEYQAGFAAAIDRFVADFKKIRVRDPKKQIYLLTTEIPREASMIGNPAQNCYYFYYLATKYKGLPVDFYRDVYVELESGKPFDEGRCRNYFLRLPDGAAFGFYTDRQHLSKVLRENPDLVVEDVIVLTWEEGLQQGAPLGRGDL